MEERGAAGVLSTEMASQHRITEDIVAASMARDLGVAADDVVVKDFKVSEGSNRGDNYACEMKAIDVEATVKGEDVERHYMAKCYPMAEFRVTGLKEARMSVPISHIIRVLFMTISYFLEAFLKF